MLTVRAIIVATLISSVGPGPWGQIYAGNLSNKVRGCDRHGCDYYGAPRKQGILDPSPETTTLVMQAKMLTIRAIIVATLISSVAAGPWAQICAGNPRNKVRGCDRYGCGHYGARRAGGRRHLGVDVICRDGSTVYAPFSGVIGGRVNPYRAGKNAINNGILLRGSGFCIHMFYIRPVRYRGRIKKGQKIGVMLPMQRVYPGMTSHVHVQNCNRSNPTRNL